MIGFDVGSSTAKIVITQNGSISEYKVVKSQYWRELLDSIRIKSTDSICTTGYFRKKVPNDYNITEITAAIYGAKHYFPDVEVVVDIGGQDTKVINIVDNSFLLNDKCSAGTGAFLELIANYFDIELNKLEDLHFQAKNPAILNETCGIFALSEMISCMVNGSEIADVIAGMHYSFARKISHMIPPCNSLALIGGVVDNGGIVSALSDLIGGDVLIPPEPQVTNALGAALYFEKIKTECIENYDDVQLKTEKISHD